MSLVNAGVQQALETLIIKTDRAIFTSDDNDSSRIPYTQIVAQATIEENHVDELEITEHPVEQGASITDHAFKRPSELVLKLGWSNSPSGGSNLIDSAASAAVALNPGLSSVVNPLLAAGAVAQTLQTGVGSSSVKSIYAQLLELQRLRALLVIYTGKRNYFNMLIQSLSSQNDFKTESSLFVTMVCREILLVNTSVVFLPRSRQKSLSTSSRLNQGTKQLKGVS